MSATAASVTLRLVDPGANMRRQYSVAVDRDLFKNHVVTCRWGRIGATGQRRHHICKSADEAQALANDLVAKRQRRGYEVVPKAGCVPALRLCAAPGSAGQAAPAARRRRRPALSPRRLWAERHQLWLPGLHKPCADAASACHAAAKASAAAPFGKAESPAPAAPASRAAAPVMQTLKKPASFAEREAAKAALLAAAAKRGLPLQCGAPTPRPGRMSFHEREMEIQRLAGPLTGAMSPRIYQARQRTHTTQFYHQLLPPIRKNASTTTSANTMAHGNCSMFIPSLKPGM